MLIHCGDFTARDSYVEFSSFIDWFGSQPHKHKIFVAGNHDFVFEERYQYCLEEINDFFTVLNDSGTEIKDKKFYGTSSQPEFFNWAFNHTPGKRLVTHTPSYGKLDYVDGKNVGCELLLSRVLKVKPKYHIFGHIHEGYGVMENKNTTFVNCSVLSGMYKLSKEPVILDI